MRIMVLKLVRIFRMNKNRLNDNSEKRRIYYLGHLPQIQRNIVLMDLAVIETRVCIFLARFYFFSLCVLSSVHFHATFSNM